MDSLLNRSHSADTATSSVTLPSSLGSSNRNSGAAINSAKRRIDLNTPVINRNGRIEEAGETDDDGRLVDEGGEDDFDAVKDSVKSNVKEPKEINLVARIPSPRPSKVSKTSKDSPLKVRSIQYL